MTPVIYARVGDTIEAISRALKRTIPEAHEGKSASWRKESESKRLWVFYCADGAAYPLLG